ncbi:MAG: NAD(P)-dependent oxidoreductase [Actinomycetota bacterium]|nr:NAD(P)-dependent oxidoreductase [Actinomycetota bacterium]
MNSSNSESGVVRERIGFAGMGTMGAPMALNLLKAGFALTVWNRTPGRAGEVVAAGAAEVDTPQELASASDIVITCLTDSPQVEEVLFAPNGLASGLAPGALLIDCSTLSPLKAQEFARRLRAQNVGAVDAPVTGGSEGAKLATLSILVGGSDEDVVRAEPVLSSMGKSVTHLGPVGAGQWAKAINQVILSGVYLGVAEGVTLALKAGLDAQKVVDALSGGAADSWVLKNRAGRMIQNDYPLGFKIALHRKDLAIGLELARTTGAQLPVSTLAADYEDALIEEGHGDDDNSALARMVRRLSGLEG